MCGLSTLHHHPTHYISCVCVCVCVLYIAINTLYIKLFRTFSPYYTTPNQNNWILLYACHIIPIAQNISHPYTNTHTHNKVTISLLFYIPSIYIARAYIGIKGLFLGNILPTAATRNIDCEFNTTKYVFLIEFWIN